MKEIDYRLNFDPGKKNPLELFRERTRMTVPVFCSKIGLTERAYYHIITWSYGDVRFSTAERIYKFTGLEPADYINPSKCENRNLDLTGRWNGHKYIPYF